MNVTPNQVLPLQIQQQQAKQKKNSSCSRLNANAFIVARLSGRFSLTTFSTPYVFLFARNDDENENMMSFFRFNFFNCFSSSCRFRMVQLRFWYNLLNKHWPLWGMSWSSDNETRSSRRSELKEKREHRCFFV